MMVLLLIAGTSISGFLFAWALVLIASKPAPHPDLSYLQKYGKPMTQDEIDYFTSTRWD